MGVALGVIAAVYQMYNSFQASRDARKAAEEQARIEKERSMYAAADIYREGAQVAGEIRAQVMASGFEMEGSPYIRAMRSLERAEEDAQRVLKFGTQEAAYITQRGRVQSEAYRNQGIAHGISAASQIAGGVADADLKSRQQNMVVNQGGM